MKAKHDVVVGEVLGIPTAFHIVSQPMGDVVRITVSCQMPGIKTEAGTLRVFSNPKNKLTSNRPGLNINH